MRRVLLMILTGFCLGIEAFGPPLCGTSLPSRELEMDGSIYVVLVRDGRQFFLRASVSGAEWALFGRLFHVDCNDPFSPRLRPQLKMKHSMVRHLKREMKDDGFVLKIQGLTTSPSQEYDEVLEMEVDLQLDTNNALISLQIRDRTSNECLLCNKAAEVLDVRRL